MQKPKTINGLMKHLRDNGAKIKNSKQKIQLINQGYYHGYKGYRCFGIKHIHLPISDYEQINRTIIYDSKIKALFYEKMMFIETALKNICLDTIISKTKSDDVNQMYMRVIESYKNSPSTYTNMQKVKSQKNFLSLQSMIHSDVIREYNKNNPKITHFFNNMMYTNIPVWSIFETLTMGDFGFLLSTLTYGVRDKVSKKIGLNLASDTNRELLYKYVYTLKDLRNAIAHNEVVYDARFRKIDPSNAMKQCLMNEMNLPYINFKDIIDYVALIVYYLKLLHVTKNEIKTFLKAFETYTNEYKDSIGASISSITINNNWKYRMSKIKNYI